MIPPKPPSQNHQNGGIDNENIRPKINFSQITTEPLKYKNDDLMDTSSDQEGVNSNTTVTNPTVDHSQSSSNDSHIGNNDNKHQRRKICFNDSVKVAHIPMRSEYSERVRSRMWSNRYEIHENATRNAIEFQAEGWDWRTVTEDEGMFVCTSSGELIHPVHCQQ